MFAGEGLLLVPTGSRLLTSSSWESRFITTARYTRVRVSKPWSYNNRTQNMNQNL
jgi:hypothetical protein